MSNLKKPKNKNLHIQRVYWKPWYFLFESRYDNGLARLIIHFVIILQVYSKNAPTSSSIRISSIYVSTRHILIAKERLSRCISVASFKVFLTLTAMRKIIISCLQTKYFVTPHFELFQNTNINYTWQEFYCNENISSVVLLMSFLILSHLRIMIKD